MNNIDTLELLLLSDNGIMTSLRLGDGLDMIKVNSICDVLEDLAKEWQAKDSIPKKAVDLFIDFYPAIESCYGLYNNEELNTIMDTADKIMDLIRKCIK